MGNGHYLGNRIGWFSLFSENEMLDCRFHCGWPLQATFSFIGIWFDENNFAQGGLRSKFFDSRSIIKKVFLINIVMLQSKDAPRITEFISPPWAKFSKSKSIKPKVANHNGIWSAIHDFQKMGKSTYPIWQWAWEIFEYIYDVIILLYAGLHSLTSTGRFWC